MKDFVLEIGVEEIPSSELYYGLESLKAIAEEIFAEQRLDFSEIRVYGTPRRMIILVSKLAEEQKAIIEEVRGPARNIAFDKNGKPTKAALGFAKSQKCKVIELNVKEINGKEYVFAENRSPGLQAKEKLIEIIPEIIQKIHFNKAMRWNNDKFSFIRPIRWVFAIHGNENLSFNLGELKSSQTTRGHRLLSKKNIKVKGVNDFFQKLKENQVIFDQKERASEIKKQVKSAAKNVKGEPLLSEKVFLEVVNLVESPQVITGEFRKDFLRLPKEVLITAMESHQRYFPVVDKDEKLLPYFIVVHNGDPRYNEDIKNGHQRVLSARLSDAEFFYNEDSKIKLVDRVKKLEGLVFYENLGNVYQKTLRLGKLVEDIFKMIDKNGQLEDITKRAAYLAKADLVSDMVVEFPDLQGTMGRIYALDSGEDKDVAEAIGQHWLPLSANGKIPATFSSRILSIADKIDTIVGCFLAGLIPSGSEDPHALRRQSAGIINITIESSLKIDLDSLVNKAAELYRQDGITIGEESSLNSLIGQFFMDRFKKLMLNRGYRYDSLNAVTQAGYQKIDFLNIYRRLESIEEIRDTSQFEDIIIGFSRCNNLRQPELGLDVDEKLLKEKEESSLYMLVKEDGKILQDKLDHEDFRSALSIIAKWKKPIDQLFDEVLIMSEDEETRHNRLRLLNLCTMEYLKVADFSKIVIPGLT